MDARAEAVARLGGRYDARVLEPSPPAVNEGPWFADDPVAPGERVAGRQVVSPVPGGDLRWSDLTADDDELAAWCAERWLAAHPRLGPVPAGLVETRQALHRLAEQVISPARRAANGKIGLRYTRGGFGTPYFGADVQIRVDGRELVVEDQRVERRAPITSLAAAAEQVGRELLGGDLELGPEDLAVDPEAARFLGQWYGFASSVLEELRAESAGDRAPSRVQLWPEHFDLALELGSETFDARAAYGLSPGDDQHPEPYAYVAPWVAPSPGPLWNATGFTGAELGYEGILAAADQRGTVLEFFRERAVALARRS